ncbi:DNA alkylation repair protein [uncultured Roseovarius sp.]|uniref:DNA alkylation repair protein n=1 Tax=Roseovarius sp. TaxID=1486281 RepID=UPI0025DB506B|nr:DNA alkylation repair protein [uncultured Roseovarius sp.]
MTNLPTSCEEALDLLRAHGDAERAKGLAEHHKVPRAYLGVPNGTLGDLAQEWRQGLDLSARLSLADALWQTDIFEARITAAKLLTQARIRPDDGAVWDMLLSWMPDFDSWAIADQVITAAQKRLVADPSRIETVAEWTTSSDHWIKRAAMIIALPFAKQNHPTEAELAVRVRVLGWAADYVRDADWTLQKSVAGWLRDLSKHDPERVEYFLSNHARHMKPFARKEAVKFLPQHPAP